MSTEIKDQKIIELEKQVIALEQEKIKLTTRSLKVYEENTELQQLQMSPVIANKMVEMKYQLQMADHFIKSKAFPNLNAEQAFTIMRAGSEMGLGEIESLSALYITNGVIKPYGDKMVGLITRHGYRIRYEDETPQGVTVHITNSENGFDERERVLANNPVFSGKQSFKLAPQNKMRFHGVRMFASFHLAHLFSGCSDQFTEEFNEAPKAQTIEQIDDSKENARILKHINSSTNIETLEMVALAIEGFDDLQEAYNAKMNEINDLKNKKS